MMILRAHTHTHTHTHTRVYGLIPLQLLQLLLLFQLASLELTNATITIAGTGERYASHPDSQVGTRWMEGYEYMARLQIIPHDLDLCGAADTNNISKNLTVTLPTDGLPVVLVTRGDDCSDTTKVQTALTRIIPEGAVKYLIIYNDAVHPPVRNRRSLENPLPEKLLPEPDPDPDPFPWNEILETFTLQQQLRAQQAQDHPITEEEDWAKPHHHDDYEHRMGVLHVTNKVGVALLHVITNQSPKDEAYGGIRVLLDGNTVSGGTFVRNLLFWIGISLMMVGCICSFCLSLRLTGADNQQAAAPARPERRRLTVEQVEELFPDYILDDDDEKQREDDSATHVECSICLDDYKAGDYMKKLPCAHEFHADCIGKWLTERHATCPLCKLDLLPEEEEEESDEEEDEEASILDTADADHHSVSSSPEEANQTSVLQFFMSTSPWRWATAIAAEPEATPTTVAIDEEAGVDQTPLLDDQYRL